MGCKCDIKNCSLWGGENGGTCYSTNTIPCKSVPEQFLDCSASAHNSDCAKSKNCANCGKLYKCDDVRKHPEWHCEKHDFT